MLEDICNINQSHPNVNQNEACYKTRDCIRQGKSEWKVALKATRNMSKCLHKVFTTSVKEILQDLPPLREYSSEVSSFIPEPRSFAEIKKNLDNINTPWIKATLNDVKYLINNQTAIIEDTYKDEPINPCMGVYKYMINSNGSLDKLNQRIVVVGDLHTKELVGYTWSPTLSMTTLKYFLAYATLKKAIVNQLYFIGAFLQEIVKSRVFVNLDSRIYKTTFHSDAIFTKYDTYTSDEQVEKLTREFNLHYRSCIGSIVYLFSTKVDLSFAVYKLAKSSANIGKVHFEVLTNILLH